MPHSIETAAGKAAGEYACPGFQAAGIAAGIKKDGSDDFGLIYSERPCAAAAVFTRNRVRAAPVQLCARLLKTRQCQAVVVNAGNANCCTGEQGMTDAAATARQAARLLELPPSAVWVGSTGVIGQYLPMDRIAAGLPSLVSSLRPDGFTDFADAIRTTDLVPKLARRTGKAGQTAYTLLGAAKGSGMIRPDMATMLCYVVTDADIPAADLQTALGRSVDRSFNRITVDGDTSTNDTVHLMANGVSGAMVRSPEDLAAFQELLDDLLLDLARKVVLDGEGATKFVEIRVEGAATDADARRIADTVADSPLVKTAFFGQDANWGRIIGAVGRAGVALDPDRIDIAFNDIFICKNGQYAGPEAEAAAAGILKSPAFVTLIRTGDGPGSGFCLTCDFSLEYVKINADYRS